MGGEIKDNIKNTNYLKALTCCQYLSTQGSPAKEANPSNFIGINVFEHLFLF